MSLTLSSQKQTEPQEHHPGDGIVFIREDRPVMYSIDQEQPKWKELSHCTGDWYLVLVPTEETDSNGHRSQDSSRDRVELYSVDVETKEPREVAIQSRAETERLLREQQVDPKILEEGHRTIVECSPHPNPNKPFETHGILWCPRTIREDKQYPNTVEDWKKLLSVIQEHISFGELCLRFKFTS